MLIIYATTITGENNAYNLVKVSHDMNKKKSKHLHTNANCDTQMKDEELLLQNMIPDITG